MSLRRAWRAPEHVFDEVFGGLVGAKARILRRFGCLEAAKSRILRGLGSLEGARARILCVKQAQSVENDQN